MDKKLKLGIEISLFVVVVVLAFLVYNSVKTNLDFEAEKKRKTKLVVEKLIDARELQYAYELKYDKYANTWDDLIRFANEDSLEFTRRIGDMEDSAQVAAGLAYTEQVKIPAIQKLMQDGVFSKNFNLNTIKYVPESDSVFSIAAGVVMAGGTKIPTFEMGATWDVILGNNDKQLIINEKEKSKKRTGYEGIRVGKLDEASTEGNWE